MFSTSKFGYILINVFLFVEAFTVITMRDTLMTFNIIGVKITGKLTTTFTAFSQYLIPI